MKPAISNLACSWGLKGPSSNPGRRKSGYGPGLGELPEISGFSFNISATAEASDFKFGAQLGFAKVHHKITPTGKVGAASGGAPQYFGVSYNNSATDGASDFKYGAQLGSGKPVIKSYAEENVGVNLG